MKLSSDDENDSSKIRPQCPYCLKLFSTRQGKSKHINNKVANHTKIVYITNKKVPKPLVKSDWRPSTVICMDDSRS